MGTRVITEKSWEHRGFDCEVCIMPAGHRCGYVFVDESHPLYGVCNSDLPNDFEPNVNGGITYAGRELGDSRWAFGFDFAHCWDIPDEACRTRRAECFPSESPEVRELVFTGTDPDARVATLDMAVADCEKLAECLDAFKDKPFVFPLDERYWSEREPDEIVCKGVRYVKSPESI